MSQPFAITPRESQVIALLVQGHTKPQIAKILFVSPHTVETHIDNLREKTNARSTLHLVAIVFGLTPIPAAA